jgi:hypothetical protein
VLCDKALEEIVVSPFVVESVMPAAAARFELISAVRDVDVIAPDAEMFVKEALVAVNCVWTFNVDMLAVSEILISSDAMLTDAISGHNI